MNNRRRFALCFLLLGILAGCASQQATTTPAADYSRATSDLNNVATGLQSSGGNTSKGSNSTSDGAGSGSSQSLGLGIITQHVTPEGSGWQTSASRYTWTTTGGAVVTEESSTALRFLDASGNPTTSIVTVEISMGPPITWEIRFLAKKVQLHQHFTSTNYAGAMSMLNTLPTRLSFPFSISSTGEGSITFLGTTVSTFEMVSIIMTMETTSSTEGSGQGNMSWRYRIPGSIYAYYYGVVSINITSLGSNPSTMTGDVYQDLTNDGTENGTKVGTITMDPATGIKITLDNGTIIYAGTF